MMQSPKPEPLSDPAEIWKLVGRFSAAFMMMVFTLWYIFRRDLAPTIVFGALSIAFHMSALKLRRHLMKEREAAIRARSEANHD